MEALAIPDELFGSGDPLDRLQEEEHEQTCAECGSPPDAYCTKGCPAQDTTSRSW